MLSSVRFGALKLHKESLEAIGIDTYSLDRELHSGGNGFYARDVFSLLDLEGFDVYVSGEGDLTCRTDVMKKTGDWEGTFRTTGLGPSSQTSREKYETIAQDVKEGLQGVLVELLHQKAGRNTNRLNAPDGSPWAPKGEVITGPESIAHLPDNRSRGSVHHI